MSNISVVEAVNQYAYWDAMQKKAKQEADKYKLIVQNNAVGELENRKTKQIKYFGEDKNCATITSTEKVTMISYAFLKDVIPQKVLEEFITEDTQYKISDTFKKMVAPILNGNYTEQTIADVIKQMKLSQADEKVAKKKLKGTNFGKDVEFIKSIEGMSEKDAEYWAYFIHEAASWERIVKLMKVSGYEAGTAEFYKALEDLQTALIVEESLKIGIDYEKEE